MTALGSPYARHADPDWPAFGANRTACSYLIGAPSFQVVFTVPIFFATSISSG